MAKILDFKLPKKAYPTKSISNLVVSSSVDDLMLIIHHALHGTDKAYQPKDRKLAAELLDELSSHIKTSAANNEKDCLTLSSEASQAVVLRYPNMYRKQTENGDGRVL